MTVQVTMSITRETEPTDGSSYPRNETLASFALAAVEPAAFRVFQSALGDLTKPTIGGYV